MKVSSPVGDFPFEPERVEIDGARLTLHGHMGAWPARVQMEPADGVALVRILGRPLLIGGLSVLLVGMTARQRFRRGG
jgi:hypothetical protein